MQIIKLSGDCYFDSQRFKPKFMKTSKTLLSLVSLTAASTLGVQAASVAVNNADFSAAGAQNNTNVPDWVNYATTNNGWGVNAGSDGATNPPSAFLGNGNGLSQELSQTIGLGTFTVDVLAERTGGGGNIVLEFFNSSNAPDQSGPGTPLASTVINLGPSNETGAATLFEPFSFSFDTDATTAGLDADNIVVGIRSAGGFIGFDDVAVDFTPVPEPSGIALLGLAGLTLLAKRRR